MFNSTQTFSGNRYSDLMSSAAWHMSVAFELADKYPGMADNHARAAAADFQSAKAEITGGVVNEPAPEPTPKKSGKRYAVATAPDGSIVVRQTERTYTHCSLFQRGTKWVSGNYFGSSALMHKATDKYPNMTIATVVMMDKRPKG